MLITFEGIDGSGKTTQIRLLEARLLANGRKVLRLREPGGTQVSERIRSILLDLDLEIAPVTELLLFSAARAQIVKERIVPALESGTTVLLDRFFDSTTAYQGAGRGVADPEWIASLHKLVTGGLVPDRTYWLDVPPNIARNRNDVESLDRLEVEDPAFFKRIHDCYDDLVHSEPDRFVRIDGTLAENEIQAAIWRDLEGLLSSD